MTQASTQPNVQNTSSERLKLRCLECHASMSDATSCASCGATYPMVAGVPDFVRWANPEERAYYDGVYLSRDKAPRKVPLSERDAAWHDAWVPLHSMRERVGNLNGKRMLCIGNGMSTKEMWFGGQGAELLIMSDLSPHAVANLRDTHDLSAAKGSMAFAAIDALDLPFEDESLDVVYGFAMVHHLPDVEKFLQGVSRVLAPGGRAVFFDDAYSPLWHGLKQTVLKPVMKYTHRANGISPQDYEFSMSGGFKESELGAMIERAGGEPWFERYHLLAYMWKRSIDRLLPSVIGQPLAGDRMGHTIGKVDQTLARFGPWHANQIRLVWGFNKPA